VRSRSGVRAECRNLRTIEVATPDEISAGFEAAATGGAEALVVLPNAIFWGYGTSSPDACSDETMTARSRSCWPPMRTATRPGSIPWALVAFRESGDSDDEAAALVRDAWSANEHVPAILAGAKPPVTSDDGYVTMGGPDEATYYVTECGAAWHRTPGAVAWLTKLAATLGPKRRTRAAVR
jgi:hypothetical protein